VRSEAMLMVSLFIILVCAGVVLADDPEFRIMKGESLGPLKVGMSSADVLKQLKEPEEKSDIKYVPATGLANQHWHYHKKGIRLTMAAVPKKEQTPTGPFIILEEDDVGEFGVEFILIKSPCQFATKKGIKLGSTYEETIKAYPPQTWSNDFNNDEKSIVVGSIVGGILIEFENAKVKSIAIGAFAE